MGQETVVEAVDLELRLGGRSGGWGLAEPFLWGDNLSFPGAWALPVKSHPTCS